MKNINLRKSVFSVLGVVLVSLFVVQNSFAQISLLAVFSKQPMNWTTQQPMLSHTMVNQLAFSDIAEIQSKQIWVGNKELVFHVQARESLKTIQRPWLQISKAQRDNIKKIVFRMALQVILHNEHLAPLKQQVYRVDQLHHSA